MLVIKRSFLFTFLALTLVAQITAAPAMVVLPATPAPEERKAAEELAHYWEKMTGEEVRVLSDRHVKTQVPRLRYHRFGAWRPHPPSGRPEITFYVGEVARELSPLEVPDGLDPHGFVMEGGGDRLILRGASPLGTQFSVYRFLHEFGGVRWYLPTELGEHVPPWTETTLPPIHRVEEPAFRSRRWSNATRFTESDWEKRNLMGAGDRFHHNLYRIFTEEVYQERPDFFIMLNGERVRPDDKIGGLNYQICFGNPDAAIFAAQHAAAFFDENPEQSSFSLGMNDTRPICECPDCRHWVDPQKIFRGVPDYSDLFFTFMNRAAEELSKTHPDKYLGTLAYYWAENVPSFPVHPQVLPYLTADRAQWQDEAFRREDQDLMGRWKRAGPERIGIYDYYYGTSFVIPRLFTAITSDSLRYANEQGIDGFYAEIYSNWSLDGPKAWLASQLLWDPQQDYEELLDEFYANFFQAAAEPMRAFFERVERIWMEQGGPVFWLKFYFDPAQLELFPPEVCADLRELLDEAIALANNDLVRERVVLFADGFRVTELYSELYHGIKELSLAFDELEFEEVVEEVQQLARTRHAIEDHYDTAIRENLLHRPTRRFEERAGFLPGTKLDGLLMRLAVRGAAMPDAIFENVLSNLAETVSAAFPESRGSLALRFSQEVVRGKKENRLQNGAFRLDELFAEGEDEGLFPSDYTPLAWQHWRSEGARRAMVLSKQSASVGALSLEARGATWEMLFQRIPVASGALLALEADVKGQVTAGSVVEIRIDWLSKEGEKVQTVYPISDRLLPGDYSDWVPLKVFAEAPADAASGMVSLVVLHQGKEDEVFFDNVRLWEIDSES